MPLKCKNDMCQNYNFQEKCCGLFQDNVLWEQYLTRCELCRGLEKVMVPLGTNGPKLSGLYAEVYKRGH